MFSNFHLVMHSGPMAGKAFPLEKSEVIIGRDLTCDVVINDPEVSRRHARLFLQGANYVLEDLGSTNGTFVNGQRLIGPYILRVGELIVFGEHVSVMFEAVQPDQAATVVAPAARPSAPAPVVEQKPAYQAPPAYTPPQPVYNPPSVTPVPAYSGQVPMQPEVEQPKKGFPIWVIVLIVILLVICGCVVILLVVDQMKLWCSLFGWLFNMISGPGTCP